VKVIWVKNICCAAHPAELQNSRVNDEIVPGYVTRALPPPFDGARSPTTVRRSGSVDVAVPATFVAL
jgi:hypothetical protein